MSYIKLVFDKNFRLSGPDRINGIAIIQNGRPLELNNYENYKFGMSDAGGAITLTLRDGPPYGTHMHPLRLRTHTLIL